MVLPTESSRTCAPAAFSRAAELGNPRVPRVPLLGLVLLAGELLADGTEHGLGGVGGCRILGNVFLEVLSHSA